MNRDLAASGLAGIFLFFLFWGGLWVSLSRLIPSGTARSVVMVALGVVFVGIFVALLVKRVRTVLAGTRHLVRELMMVALELALLLAAFASMYQQIGIIDNTVGGYPVRGDFWSALYYSVVTFTTLGYGDFYPRGVGRALAALEALTGYLILGILASTAASVISPNERAGWKEREEEERGG